MSKPFRFLLLVGAGLLMFVLVAYYCKSTPKPDQMPPANAAVTTPPNSSPSAVFKPAAGARGEADPKMRLKPDQVLATVNGKAIKLWDVLPVQFNERQQDLEVSASEVDFLLKRAVDRELIFQAAKTQGIVLNDSQHQQLLNMKSLRNLPEPGGIAKLNRSTEQQDMEMRDAEAFLLQTSLMQVRGLSPDVTETQVQMFYQQNQASFGDLPADEPARSRAWANIAYNIRQQLASSTRSSYNTALVAYMARLKASADIRLIQFAN